MNIKVDMDITPEEFRRLMGLPDLQPFYQESLDKFKERLNTGVYDPQELMKPFFSQANASMDVFQKMMTGFVNAGLGKAGRDGER
jgi:hypothetical protein